MSIKKQVIKYKSLIEEDKTEGKLITPAKQNIPKWYKDISRWKDGKMTHYPEGGIAQSVKHCLPYLESMTNGYLIHLPADILVARENGEPFITWKHYGDPLFQARPKEAHSDIPFPAGYDQNVAIAWKLKTLFKVPKGYSVLVTHPFNRFDLPFITATAIIDGGYTVPQDANVPFFLKEGFEGIIEKNTPIMQILPFKNTDWKLFEDDSLIKESADNAWKARSVISGWYQKTFWNKKDYA